jgi:hypothetical protein
LKPIHAELGRPGLHRHSSAELHSGRDLNCLGLPPIPGRWGGKEPFLYQVKQQGVPGNENVGTLHIGQRTLTPWQLRGIQDEDDITGASD